MLQCAWAASHPVVHLRGESGLAPSSLSHMAGRSPTGPPSPGSLGGPVLRPSDSGPVWASLHDATSLCSCAQRRFHKCGIARNTLFPRLHGNTCTNTAHFAADLCHGWLTSQTRSPLVVHEDPQVFFCKSAFYPIDIHLYHCTASLYPRSTLCICLC